MVLLTLAAWGPPRGAPSTMRGWPLYERRCSPCHGLDGDGRGPAAPYVWPAPRAFARGEIKWRSTVVGQPPSDDDLRATITLGAPGTSMPAFASLSSEELDDLVAIVKAFAPNAYTETGRSVAIEDAEDPPAPDPARGAELWLAKGCPACHGPEADGRGPSAFALKAPPYDLRQGLHRPRAEGRDAYRLAAATSIATGLTGTAMPSFAATLEPDELWALADHIVELASKAKPSRDLPAALAAADRKAPIMTGTWPGFGASDEVALFGGPIPPQGPAPSSLAPAQASLRGRQCARCHAKQFREWELSLHRGAASPGLLAQTEYGMDRDERAGCLRCHAPLAEQARDATLRSDSVSCAGCHVRTWVRHGPPVVAPSLLALPDYPLTTSTIYERADFCMPCHQLPPRTAVAGRPLLDTYREWLDGPYMRRGVQCQHCHMPNREHSVLGIHDPATFRQGIELTGTAQRKAGAVTVVANLRNIGAGHYLPTTPTPAVWLSITLRDASGKHIEGGTYRLRIGRDIWFDGVWHERSDTRIAPGATARLGRRWTGGRTADATTAEIIVEVYPDDFYERFYAERLKEKLEPAQRALYEQAQKRARGSHYIAERRALAIPK